MIAAVEHRVVGVAAAVLEPVGEDPPHDALGLRLVVGRRRDPDRVPRAVLAPELLVEELRVVGDQRVGRAQDAHRRPVVLLQLDDLERRVVARQLREVVDRRAAPAVDRLVVVADRGEVRRVARQRPQQAILRGVGVLVLVDEELRAALAPARGDRGPRFQQRDRQRDQVVEVDRLVGAQRVVVAQVRLRSGRLVVALRGLDRRRRGDERVLPAADRPLRGARPRRVGGAEEVGDHRSRCRRDRGSRTRASGPAPPRRRG